MRPIHRHPRIQLLLLLLAALWVALSTGCGMLADVSDALYPTETPRSESPPQLMVASATSTSEPSQTPTLAPTLTSPAPTQTTASVSSTSPAPIRQPDQEQRLVFAQGSSIYRGNYLGGEPVEVASVPQLDAWDFRDGLLATTRGRKISVVDLNRGRLNSFVTKPGPEVEYSSILWGAAGKSLLHAAVVTDKNASTFERSVELRALDPDKGTQYGHAMIRDVTGVRILRYDEDSNRVLLISQGGDPAFSKAEYYDLGTGQRIATFPAKGNGEVVVSPDARHLLAEQFGGDGETLQLSLYDLAAGGEEPPRSWQHPERSHSVSHVWSSDGRYVAYLLRDGGLHPESEEGLGVWVLDIASMQAKQVIEEASPSSSLIGWTPDSLYIVGYHRGAAGDSHFYAVRPDGGDRRILPLDPEARILGWMRLSHKAPVPKVSVDPWEARFVDTEGDPAAMAEAVAELVFSQVQTDDEELTRQVAQYLELAGWPIGLAGPSIKRISEGIFVAQLPPLSIYVLESGLAQAVASGHVILDARLEDDDLGLIFGVIGASAVQPAYVLLRRQADGSWGLLWTPQGQRDWIATDGEIRFVGTGLEALRVAGTSFALEYGEEEVFAECHACPHRRLMATWSRQGDGYVRQTELPADAPLADVYWEMTDQTPYALLHECLRRMRLGLPADELVSEPEVLDQMRELGLLDEGVRLAPEAEMVYGIRFADVEGKNRFYALSKDGKLVHIERVSS